MNPYFLTYEQVIHIHKRQIEEYGGSFGILDRGKLESAVNAPRQTFDGQYLHESIFDMAASYLSSIASNHAFMDGNKRTAAQAAIVFLSMNGYEFEEQGETEIADWVIAYVNKRKTKNEIASYLADRPKSKQ